MKNKLKYFISALLIIVVVASCKKDEHKDYFNGGSAPALTASSTSPMVLNINNKNNDALKLSWTNPNYMFTTGVSSHDVSYTLQIDTTGANFASPKMQQITIANDLSTTFTVGSLNSALLTMGLAENVPHNIEFRVKSSIDNTVPLYSNVIKMTITPYLDVKYPVPANLYITGSATPGNWMGGGDPELGTQKFSKVSSSQFKITIQLSANNSFLFVPVYGDWSNKYGGTGSSNNSNNVNGDDFKPGGSDLKAPATTGTYTITVDFKTGKYTVQ